MRRPVHDVSLKKIIELLCRPALRNCREQESAQRAPGSHLSSGRESVDEWRRQAASHTEAVVPQRRRALLGALG